MAEIKGVEELVVKVVVASDKFKGSLSAAEVVGHLAAALQRAVPGVKVVGVPVADGGEGTVAAAVASGYHPVPVVAAGPTGEPVATAYAARAGVAVVELADVSGLGRLSHGRTEPLLASSYGTGEVLRSVLDAGLRHLVLGVGGSACTDGGAGLLQALGARLVDRFGDELSHGGGALARVARLDLSGLHPALAASELVLACDVDNPLLGATGSAAVYGPQKGASPAQVRELDGALRSWARVVAATTGADLSARPGAGAAGGVGFAALALLGASVRSGCELVLELVELVEHLRGASLVITGEGCLDEQTLRGKAPMGVAAAARSAGVPVLAVAGSCRLSGAALTAVGISQVYTLSELEPDRRRSMPGAGRLLEQLGPRIAADWLADA